MKTLILSAQIQKCMLKILSLLSPNAKTYAYEWRLYKAMEPYFIKASLSQRKPKLGKLEHDFMDSIEMM